MRPIKFRGKAKNRNNKWIYGNYRHYDGITWIFPEDEEAAYDAHQVHPETIGQFWKKDRKGVDMYVGDKITVHQFLFDGNEIEELHTAIIEMGDDGIMLRFIAGDWIRKYTCEDDHLTYASFVYGLHEESFEKIGNIHKVQDGI